MANPEHLTILKNGVGVWNKWRKENSYIIPDLSGADLRNENLKEVNFAKTILAEVNLGKTKLFNAKLMEAKLNKAYLIETYLFQADLRKADLEGAKLFKANLNDANLNDTNLNQAYLDEAQLERTNLIKANLKDACLKRANLRKANLSQSCLDGVDLSRVNLFGATLSQVTLLNATLIATQALNTNFSNATFTGVCIQDWNINSKTNFDGVICDYVYKRCYKQERRPSDPNKNFESGEFTKLFQKALETVDLIFLDGIDWQAFLTSFEKLKTSFEKLKIECGSEELSIHSFENKGDGAFVIKVNVPVGAEKAEIEKYLKMQYKLEAQLEAKSEQLANLMEITKLLASKNLQNIIDITNTADSKSMSETNKSKYDLRNAKVNGIVDTAQSGSHQEFTQHNYASEQKQTVAEAAKEIQQLLEQLSKTYPITTSKGKNIVVGEAVEQIEKNPTLKAKVINALKAGGTEAFKEAIDHPLVNILVATIEGWQQEN